MVGIFGFILRIILQNIENAKLTLNHRIQNCLHHNCDTTDMVLP